MSDAWSVKAPVVNIRATGFAVIAISRNTPTKTRKLTGSTGRLGILGRAGRCTRKCEGNKNTLEATVKSFCCETATVARNAAALTNCVSITEIGKGEDIQNRTITQTISLRFATLAISNCTARATRPEQENTAGLSLGENIARLPSVLRAARLHANIMRVVSAIGVGSVSIALTPGANDIRRASAIKEPQKGARKLA